MVPPSAIPQEVVSTLTESSVCEFAVLRGDGTPITYPLGNYPGTKGFSVEVCVGLTFPWKAELARRNPKVCVSYCRPTHPELSRPPLVVVYGHAAVRDRDLQANTDRYVWWLKERFPDMFGRIPGPLLRWLSFYLARIWISVTPRRILWWPEGDPRGESRRWDAPNDQRLPESDPPPVGPASRIPSGFVPPDDWRPGLNDALGSLGPPLLTVVDDGFPVTFPALHGASIPDGVLLQLSPAFPAPPRGRACLSFHIFEFTGAIPAQENRSFVGFAEETNEGVLFRVERELVSGSLPNMPSMLKGLYKVWRTRGRLPVEAARRGQPVPRVRL